MSLRAIAFIPARAGSKRVVGKNVRVLGGHPMLAYTVAAARASGVFERVVLSTDSEHIARIGRHYGAEVPFLRPPELAADASTDLEWLQHALDELDDGGLPEVFGILRPTSPFRRAATIHRAWAQFVDATDADSLRAVEPVSQHPGKMWTIRGDRLVPILPVQPAGVPWHNRPTQSLPPVLVQNASLELAWTRCITELGSISGERIVPFLTEGVEGLDVNTELDVAHAEALVAADASVLPAVDVEPWTEGTDG